MKFNLSISIALATGISMIRLLTGISIMYFLIPFSIGICTTLGGNVLTDAFGIVALIAMMPLISVQISGIIYKIKKSKIDSSITENSENEIINIDWSEIID